MAACRAYRQNIQSLNQRSYHDIYLESIVTRLRSSGEKKKRQKRKSQYGWQADLLVQKHEGKRKRKYASSVRISGQQSAGSRRVEQEAFPRNQARLHAAFTQGSTEN